MNTTIQPQTSERLDYNASLLCWWMKLGETPQYPTTRETALRLLGAMDFIVDDSRIEYLERVGLYAAPGDEEWDSWDIIKLASACKALRWVREEPDSLHWESLPPFAKQRYEAKQNGQWAPYCRSLGNWSIRHLALMLLHAPDREEAERSFALIEAKLEAIGCE